MAFGGRAFKEELQPGTSYQSPAPALPDHWAVGPLAALTSHNAPTPKPSPRAAASPVRPSIRSRAT
jgi:hypothetical protein